MPEEWPITIPHPHDIREFDIDGRAVITVMETGRPRTRTSYGVPAQLIKVTWNFTEDQYSDFRDFYEVNLEGGSLHFVITGWEGGVLTPRTVAFWGGYSLEGQDNPYRVQAVLELIDDEDEE